MSASTTTHTSAPDAHPNAALIAAVIEHHTQLAEQLHVRTNAILAGARAGDCTAQRDELHKWYRAVLLSHIVAEEQALYRPAAGVDASRLLVRGLLFDTVRW